jgi:myo-inositol-1(or 4)-monophosphatase
MNSILATAVEAARTAGAFILDGSSRIDSLDIEQKSLHDYVSEIDRESEKLITSLVKERFPDHQILGEEYGVTEGHSDFKWIIDPLDGTTNFLRGIAHYAVSIAIAEEGQIRYGVIYDPVKQELFTASRGEGAFLNDKRLSVSGIEKFDGALLATGVPFSGKLLAEVGSFSNAMEALLAQHTSGIRRLGSAALDLAYVAAGRYDGYWEASLKPWDIAGGILLVEEAGGLVADFKGNENYLESGDIVAATPAVFGPMSECVKKSYVR